LAQWEGQLGAVLVPGPGSGEIGDNRLQACLCNVLLEHDERLLKTPIIGRLAAPVASSSIDMLAGLSKWEVLRMPPGFWASAGPLAKSPTNNAVATAKRT
jgi:hypothetical protein